MKMCTLASGLMSAKFNLFLNKIFLKNDIFSEYNEKTVKSIKNNSAFFDARVLALEPEILK